MKKNPHLGVLALLVPLLVGGATAPLAYTLEGSLVDRANGAPIEGATVSLVAAGRSVTTGPEGGFTFRGVLITGADELVITHADYRVARLPLGMLPDGTWRIDITMVKEAVPVGIDRPTEPVAR